MSQLHQRRTGGIGIRLLAIVGACNVCFALSYNVPVQIFGIHQGTWIDDVQERSYLTGGICGPGTDYACPGPGRPIHRNDSIHLTPQAEEPPAPWSSN
jgi:hypothetical protein